MFNRCGDRIRVLQGQVLMVEEHVNRGGDFARVALEHRRQNPRGFGEHEMRHPGPAFDKSLSRCDLLGVVSRDQTNQYVRVNGVHGAS